MSRQPLLSEEETALLEQLEKEGLFAPNVSRRVRQALQLSGATRSLRLRVGFVVGVVLLACVTAGVSRWAYDDYPAVSLTTCLMAIVLFVVASISFAVIGDS